MTINSIQDLFSQLLKTTTPSGVKEILTEIGDVADIGLDNPFGKLKLHWHPYPSIRSRIASMRYDRLHMFVHKEKQSPHLHFEGTSRSAIWLGFRLQYFIYK